MKRMAGHLTNRARKRSAGSANSSVAARALPDPRNTIEGESHDQRHREAVSGGWPRILSNLKSLLETGNVVLPNKPV
jgi:hypothetical protein